MARIIPKLSDRGPAMSWSIGKEVVGADRIHRGWFIDQGLDDDLDEAAADLGWIIGKLAHLDGQTRPHWLVPMPCPLHVLILGVPYMNIFALARNDIAYSGLGCRWRSGDSSRLGAMVIHPDLLRAGFVEPFPIMASSTSTDDLLTALLAHNQVLNACEAAAANAGSPRAFDFWEVALPFGAGEKTPKGKDDKTSMISPIICAHPPAAQQDVDYLRGLLAPPLVRRIVVDRWPKITAWAAEVARIDDRLD
jgi:hypothetical protein